MQKMKKTLSVLIALIMVLGALPLTAFASEYGPLPKNGDEIMSAVALFYYPDDGSNEPVVEYIFDGEKACAVENTAYDLNTNTLTVNGLQTNRFLKILNMGEDFTVEVVGENKVGAMTVNGTDVPGHDAYITFTGEGTLTVNEEKEADYAVYMENEPAGGTARFTAGEDVTLNLYGRRGAARANHVNSSDVFELENNETYRSFAENSVEIRETFEGFVFTDCDERYLGKICNPKNGESGVFVYNEVVENETTVGYRVSKYYSVYANSRLYYVTEPGAEETFYSVDEFNAAFEPEKALSNGGHQKLSNRCGPWFHDVNVPVYTSPYSEELVVINDEIYTISEIEGLTDEYYFSVKTGDLQISDLTPTGDTVNGFRIENDSTGPKEIGDLCNVANTPENTYYVACFLPEGDWQVMKFVYDSGYDFYFQDYSFGNNGELVFSEEEFASSGYSSFVYDQIEADVVLMADYTYEGFGLTIYNDGEGNSYGVDSFLLEQEGIMNVYDAVPIDDLTDFMGNPLYAFFPNEEVDKDSLEKIDGRIVLDNAFDVTLIEIYANAVDNFGKVYKDGDVIEIKAGEKIFIWFETDFEFNPACGVTPFVGFSENDEHIWTLTPAGFKITAGTGNELGYEGIESFGIEIDTKGMAVTTEAPLKFWLYEFDGKFPGQDGFDWNSLVQVYEGTVTVAVAPNEGWNHFSDGHWEYIKEGVSLTGWQKIGKKWYYFDKSGVMQTGFVKVGKSNYYFDESGAMKTGWFKLTWEDGYYNWYYASSSGALLEGWQQIKDSWYYFVPGECWMVFGGIVEIDGKTYCFDGDGKRVSGWQKDGGKWYYFNSSGVMVKGWQKISKKWYYFDKTGAMLTGWQKISKKWYYFDKSGVMLTGWQKISKKWYYFDSSGVMTTGWLKSGGKWYYFGSDGAMLANCSKKIGKKTYKFDKNGVCLNP